MILIILLSILVLIAFVSVCKNTNKCPNKLYVWEKYYKNLNKISELIRNADVSIEIFIPEITKSIIFSLSCADLIKEKNKVVIYCCDFPQEYKVLHEVFTIKKVYLNAYTHIFIDKKISFILIDREKYVYIDDDNVEIGDSFTKIKEFCDFIFCSKVNPDA